MNAREHGRDGPPIDGDEPGPLQPRGPIPPLGYPMRADLMARALPEILTDLGWRASSHDERQWVPAPREWSWRGTL